VRDAPIGRTAQCASEYHPFSPFLGDDDIVHHGLMRLNGPSVPPLYLGLYYTSYNQICCNLILNRYHD
jgi:hypothetical protein